MVINKKQQSQKIRYKKFKKINSDLNNLINQLNSFSSCVKLHAVSTIRMCPLQFCRTDVS
jgi:hypothetical protein